eukprot:5845194-Pleurochrysis_carterae.AAC.1
MLEDLGMLFAIRNRGELERETGCTNHRTDSTVRYLPRHSRRRVTVLLLWKVQVAANKGTIPRRKCFITLLAK